MNSSTDTNSITTVSSKMTGRGSVRINAEDAASIEVSLKTQISAGRRRWNLLKNLHIASRRTSLTETERTFLKKIHDGRRHCSLPAKKTQLLKGGDQIHIRGAVSFSLDENEHGKTNKSRDNREFDNDNNDEEHLKEEEKTQARRKLRLSITQRRLRLSDKEAAFLETLVATEDISTDDLLRTDYVLNRDNVYAGVAEEVDDGDDDEDNNQEEKKTDHSKEHLTPLLIETNKQSRRKSLELLQSQKDPSFRRALWKSLQASTRHLDTSNGGEEEHQDQPEEQMVANHKNKKQEGFVYYLTSVFGHDQGIANIFGSHNDINNNHNDSEGHDSNTDDKFKKNGDLNKLKQSEDDDSVLNNKAITFALLGTSVEDTEAQPHVLSPPLMDSLRPHMPYAVQEDNFWLKYSLVRDGAHMHILLEQVRSSARTVLAIETVDGEVFGSFTSSPWRQNGNHYYGSAEAFLWRMRQSRLTPCRTVMEQARLESDVEIFKWSGENRNIQLTNPKKLIVGGGEPLEKKPTNEGEKPKEWGFGIALNSDLSSGTSGLCVTFGSPGLSQVGSSDFFEVVNLEVWTMTPVDSIEEAENLELARQFVFDHGGILAANKA